MFEATEIVDSQLRQESVLEPRSDPVSSKSKSTESFQCGNERRKIMPLGVKDQAKSTRDPWEGPENVRASQVQALPPQKVTGNLLLQNSTLKNSHLSECSVKAKPILPKQRGNTERSLKPQISQTSVTAQDIFRNSPLIADFSLAAKLVMRLSETLCRTA